MSIRFTCPHCGVTTDVSDEYAGRSGPCSQCGRTVTVPPSGAAPVYAAVQQRSQSSAWAIILVVVLVVLLVLGGLLVIGFFACSGFMTALLLPARQSAREAARRAQCANNLKQIALAMHNYHAKNGCLPPAYTADENGKPMHSWRVLILPFLEQKPLYDQYRFDEAWDSPHNRALADLMPGVYRCPSDGDSLPNQTSYAVIVGPKARPGRPAAMFSGDQPVKFADVTDGLSNTIMVVEAAGAGINWMEPRDLDFEDMDFKINGGSGGGIQSGHKGGANVASGDGSVRFLPDSLDRETLRRMILRDDGTVVPDFY